MYKSSRYNLRVSDADGEAILFNTASAQRLLLTASQREAFERYVRQPALLEEHLSARPSPASNQVSWTSDSVEDSPDPAADPSADLSVEDSVQPGCDAPGSTTRRPVRCSDAQLPARLLEHGFFVPEHTDELGQVLRRMAQERLQHEHISLTLSMTSDCDLACPYCVIKTTQGRGGMPEHVQAALLRWWERQLVGRRTCSFEWMGGEPLLYPETLLSLGEALMARATRAGVRCTAQVLITNGTQLTPELAERLKVMGITQLQITLDGPPESHDACRPGVGGVPSFERIFANLVAVAGILPIKLRVNISARNAHLTTPLLDRLAAAQLPESVFVYPARVYEAEAQGACGTFSHCVVSPAEFARTSLRFELDAMERGFGRTALPAQARGGYCGAYHQSYFVVGPDGLLYRCPARVGQVRDSAVGSVFDFAPSPWMDQNQQYYDNLGPTTEKGCFSCKVLPLCLGGCPEESKVSQKAIDECSPWRFRLKHQLVIEQEWQKATFQEEIHV